MKTLQPSQLSINFDNQLSAKYTETLSYTVPQASSVTCKYRHHMCLKYSLCGLRLAHGRIFPPQKLFTGRVVQEVCRISQISEAKTRKDRAECTCHLVHRCPSCQNPGDIRMKILHFFTFKSFFIRYQRTGKYITPPKLKKNSNNFKWLTRVHCKLSVWTLASRQFLKLK